jgi:hypothetical protein
MLEGQDSGHYYCEDGFVSLGNFVSCRRLPLGYDFVLSNGFLSIHILLRTSGFTITRCTTLWWMPSEAASNKSLHLLADVRPMLSYGDLGAVRGAAGTLPAVCPLLRKRYGLCNMCAHSHTPTIPITLKTFWTRRL